MDVSEMWPDSLDGLPAHSQDQWQAMLLDGFVLQSTKELASLEIEVANGYLPDNPRKAIIRLLKTVRELQKQA